MGHPKKHKQLSFIPSNSTFQFNHGGVLRKKRRGRFFRPLSSKEPLHLVFKAHRAALRETSFRGRQSFKLCHYIIKKYSRKFFVKIEQLSIQGDHLHLLIRCSRRSQFQSFFRVVAGQMAQVFAQAGLLKSVTDTSCTPKLWRYRPFTRVVRSWKALRIIRDYMQLNEQEARGKIQYNSKRLAGLSTTEWAILWSG